MENYPMYNDYMTWDQYNQLQNQINWYYSYNNWIAQQSVFIPGKHCSKCCEFKPYTEYHKNKCMKDGYCNYCKICKNKDSREYHQMNNDLCKQRAKTYYQNHIEEKRVYNQKQENKSRKNQIRKHKYHNDINFRMKLNLGNRVRAVLFENSKSDHTLNLIGCTIPFLKAWLEFQFYDDRSWENYGTWWHLDHVRPCASFDLSYPEQQIECFNWRNLSPLRADKNISKNDKIDNFQIMLQELRVKVFLS